MTITVPSYATPTLVAKRIAQRFYTMSPLIKTGYKGYEFMFDNNKFSTPGTTFNVALDNRFTLQRTDAITLEGIVDRTVPVTVQNPYRMGAAYTTTAQKLFIRNLDEQTINPMAATISAGIEQDLIAQFELYGYNFSDFTTTYNSSASGLLDTPSKVGVISTFFRNYSIPSEMPWYGAIRPDDYQAMIDGFPAAFFPKTNDSVLHDDIKSKDAKRINSYDLMWSEVLYKHVGGTAGGATGVTVSSTASTGTTVVLAGLTPGLTFIPGDRIVFLASYKVNPVTRDDISSANFQAVVAAAATVGGGGTVSLTVYVGPGGINSTVSDPNRNLNRALTAGDSVQIITSFCMNLFYTSNALLFAPIEQEPFDVAPNQRSAKNDAHSKLRFRVTKYPSPGTNQNTMYVDALMAMGIAPEGTSMALTDA